jgi:hypothetical protein
VLYPADSTPAPLLSKPLSLLLSSPLVALLSLLRMKYCCAAVDQPSSAVVGAAAVPPSIVL